MLFWVLGIEGLKYHMMSIFGLGNAGPVLHHNAEGFWFGPIKPCIVLIVLIYPKGPRGPPLKDCSLGLGLTKP